MVAAGGDVRREFKYESEAMTGATAIGRRTTNDDKKTEIDGVEYDAD